MRPRPFLALVGPTASGKTEASIGVAASLGAEILCIDSMLVYRGMDVGTAKPTSAQRDAVPHHLLDLVEPSEPFSVARFQAAAARSLADIEGRGQAALLVAGSALYLRAVVDGFEIPETEPATRGLLEAEVRVLGPQALYRRLASFDPAAAARIEPANGRRVVRALEVAAITGRPFSSGADAWASYPEGALAAAGVDLPRDVLRRRIEERTVHMMPGLLAETRALLDGGSERFLTSRQAIGYAEAVACLRGRMSEEEAAAAIIRRTKALARRQMAWFRRDPRIRWFPAPAEGAAGIQEALTGFFRGALDAVEVER